MKIIEEEEHSHKWWMGTKTDWAVKRGDDWWIIPGSEFPEKKVSDLKKKKKSRKKESSLPVKTNYLMMIFLATALGMSLALNLIFYLTK